MDVVQLFHGFGLSRREGSLVRFANCRDARMCFAFIKLMRNLISELVAIPQKLPNRSIDFFRLKSLRYVDLSSKAVFSRSLRCSEKVVQKLFHHDVVFEHSQHHVVNPLKAFMRLLSALFELWIIGFHRVSRHAPKRRPFDFHFRGLATPPANSADWCQSGCDPTFDHG